MNTIADASMVMLRCGISDSSTDEEKAVAVASLTYAEGLVKKFLRYDPVMRTRTEFCPQMTPSGFATQAVWEANAATAYLRRTSGASTNELQIKHLPIRKTDPDGTNAIDLRIDYDGRFGARSGSFAADTQKTEGADFWPDYDGVDSNGIAICRDGIVRSIGLWPEEPGAVKITYTAGYTYQEFAGQDTLLDASPIQNAVVEEASRRAKHVLSNGKHTSLGWLTGPLSGERLGDYSWTSNQAIATRLFSGMYELLPETREQLHTFINFSLVM